jgi:hypothetical protein
MRQFKAALFILTFVMCAFAQDSVPTQQLTEVPPKPTCVKIFSTGTCADMWNAYTDAFAKRQREELQLYVSKQKQAASSQATAPLLQQIAIQQNEIKKLQADLPGEIAAAHKDGMVEGGVYSGGGLLILLSLIFLARKFTVTRKPLSRAASV